MMMSISRVLKFDCMRILALSQSDSWWSNPGARQPQPDHLTTVANS